MEHLMDPDKPGTGNKDFDTSSYHLDAQQFESSGTPRGSPLYQTYQLGNYNLFPIPKTTVFMVAQPSSPVPDCTWSLMDNISASYPWDSITLILLTV